MFNLGKYMMYKKIEIRTSHDDVDVFLVHNYLLYNDYVRLIKLSRLGIGNYIAYTFQYGNMKCMIYMVNPPYLANNTYQFNYEGYGFIISYGKK